MAATENPDSRPLPPGWNAHFEPSQQRWYYVQLSSLRAVYEHPADLDLPPGIDDIPAATTQSATVRRPLPTPGKQTLTRSGLNNQTVAPIVNQASSLPTPPNSATANLHESAPGSPAPASPVSMRHNQSSPAPSRPMSAISHISSSTSRPMSSGGQSPVSPPLPTITNGQNSGGFSRPTSVISPSGSPVNRPSPSTLTAAQRLYNSAGAATAAPLVSLDNLTTLSTAPSGDVLSHTRSSHTGMSSVVQSTSPRNGSQVGHQYMDRTQSLRASMHMQQQQGALLQNIGRSQTYSAGPGTNAVGGTAVQNVMSVNRPAGVQHALSQGRPPNQHMVQSAVNTTTPRPPQNFTIVMRPPTGPAQVQSISTPAYTAVQPPQGQPGSPPPPLSPISLSGSSTGELSPPSTSLLLSTPSSTSSAPTTPSVGSSTSASTSPVIPPSLSYHPAPATSSQPTFSSMYQQPISAQHSVVTTPAKSNNAGRFAAQLLAKTTGAVVSSVVSATTGVQVGRLVNALTSPAMINKLWQAIPSSSKTGTGIGQADLQAVLEGKLNAKYSAVLAALQKQQQIHQQQVMTYQKLLAQVQAQMQAGIPVHQMPVPPQNPPIDYATLIAEVKKLKAAAEQQVKIQQQMAAQLQAQAQQQALAQKISYAQVAHHVAGQPLVHQQAHGQNLQQHLQPHGANIQHNNMQQNPPQQVHPQHQQQQQSQQHQPPSHAASIQHAQQIHPQQQQHQQNQPQQQHQQQPLQHQPLQHASNIQLAHQNHPQQVHSQQQQHQQHQHLQQPQQSLPHRPPQNVLQQQHPQQHPQQAASQATHQQQQTYHQQGMHHQNQQPTNPHHQHANHSHQVSPQMQQQQQQQQPWQSNGGANVNQVNPQMQLQQPWQPNSPAPIFNLPQQHQQAFNAPPQQHHHNPQHAQHQHQQTQQQQHQDSSDNNPLNNFIQSLTNGNNQQSQNQAPAYNDGNNNFSDSSWYNNDQSSPTGDLSTDPSSPDGATQFYDLVSQSFDPNSNDAGSNNFSDMMNAFTQNLQVPQLSNFDASTDFTASVLNNLTQFQPGTVPSFGDPGSSTTADIINSFAQNLQSNQVTNAFGGDNGGLASGLFNTLIGNSTDANSGNGGAFDLSGLASGLGQAMAGMNTDNINLDVDLNLNFGN